jgi:hypothetical protein
MGQLLNLRDIWFFLLEQDMPETAAQFFADFLQVPTRETIDPLDLQEWLTTYLVADQAEYFFTILSQLK